MINTEKELCDIFISYVKELGFNVYPEYQDWDIVIERNGHIVGVEAKLSKNLHLLTQLLSKDNVHFKVALIPFETFKLKQPVDDWIFIAKRLKILPVMVDKSVRFHWNVKNLFYYRWHPRKLLKIPDFHYNTPAGVPAPRKVTERNINFVKLELFALENNNRIKQVDAKRFGFDRVPRWYYTFSWKDSYWYLDPFHRASKDYPHILKGILGK